MQIDDTDLKVVLYMFNLQRGKTTSAWNLAKTLSDGNVGYKILTDKTRFLIYRLKKLCKYGIMDVKRENGKDNYYLLSESCIMKKVKFDGMFEKCLGLKIEGKWVIFEI